MSFSISASPNKSSLRMSDLDTTATTSSRLSMKNFERSTNDDDFVQTIMTQNRDIESTRKEIQTLMTKATGYCKNSGLTNDNAELPSTPPRYSGKNKFSAPSSPYTQKSPGGASFFSSSLI